MREMVNYNEPAASWRFRMKSYQELSDIFPLSEEESGSGLDTAPEMEPSSGSGAEAIPAPRAARRPELPPELGLQLSEEALLL